MLRPSTVELSHQSPLWQWTHLPPPCILLPCPLSQGLLQLFSNLGLLWPLLRGALRWHKLPRSMAYCPPFALFLLPPSCTCLSVVSHPIGRTRSHLGAAHVYCQDKWGLPMSNQRTSDLALPLDFFTFTSLLLLSPF